MNIALYIHFPFCKKKCPYCDFYSIPQKRRLTGEYINALRKEIQHYSQSSPFQGVAVSTIYFGGGTPSLLSVNQLALTLDFLARHFDISENAEITCEANPGTISLEKLYGYRDAGVNRITLGIQSLNDQELQTLGRIHDSAAAVQAFELARSAGFDNLAVDMIFGVPCQSLNSWQKSLIKIINMCPEHISTYSLTFEPQTPFYQSQKTGKIKQVNEELQRDMFLTTIEMLESAGYEHYEISNFCLPGFRSRHNQSYWDGTPYLGLGPSAHSFWDSKRWQNVTDVSAYVDSLLNGKSVVVETEELSLSQKILEFIMLGLRKTEGIDLEKFRELFGFNFLDGFNETISQIENDWSLNREKRAESLFQINEERVALSRDGLLLYGEICVRLACSANFED